MIPASSHRAATFRRSSMLMPLLVVVILSGCATSGASGEVAQPTATAAADTETAEGAAGDSAAVSGNDIEVLPADVPLDAPVDIYPQSWVLHWIDPFATDSRYSETVSDDGDGYRAYIDAVTGCETMLFAGGNEDLDPSADDRTLSDDLLAGINEITLDQVTRIAVSTGIPQPTEDATIMARMVVGEGADGSSRATMVRVIGSHGQGAFVHTVCPPGADAFTELRGLLESRQLTLTVVPSRID